MMKKILLYLLLLVAITSVKAQNSTVPVVSNSNDNFTSFTPQKFYADNYKLTLLTPAAYRHNPDFGKVFIGKRFADSGQLYERLDKRTLKSRTYTDINDPSKVVIESGYTNLNYTDEQGWLRAVDTKLKPVTNGWAAAQQETPVYLYNDGSTAISLGNHSLMVFNKDVRFNTSDISTNNYTVGDNGMYIKNAATNTDKLIRFGRGKIETDYRIDKPLKLNGDLTTSEDIVLPAGYTIADNGSSLTVKDVDGKAVAEIKYPFCYDSNHNSITGSYKLYKQQNGYRIELVVPATWLNDKARVYPVTIDPLVTGITSVWYRSKIASCYNAIEDTTVLLVDVPGRTTITGFYIQCTLYVVDMNLSNGQMFFWTPCNDTVSSDIQSGAYPGYIHIAPPYNFLLSAPAFSCCFPPSCSDYYIPLAMGIARYAGNAGCDTTEIYYDPNNNDGYPYEAYVVGHTVESSWSIPPPICGGCNLPITAQTNYGVPPYTITHSWADAPVIYQGYSDTTCTSSGTATINLSVPNCSGAGGLVNVPAPVIVDACGDTVKGLILKQVTLVPAPNNPTITISVTGDSLISSAGTYNQWNFNGLPISDSTRQVLVIKGHSKGWYSVTVTNPANGCTTTSDSTTSINQLSAISNQLSVYPNPFNNSVNIKISSKVKTLNGWSLRVNDVLGRIVYSAESLNYNNAIDLSGLANGVYLITIANETGKTVYPIVKQSN